MYSTCIFGERGNKAVRLLASSIIFFCVGSHAVAASDAPPTMRYQASGAFPTSGVSFDLLAVDGNPDDCDDAGIGIVASAAAAGERDDSDTIVMAKLDADKKTRIVKPKGAASSTGSDTATKPMAGSAATSAVTLPVAEVKPAEPTWEIIVADKTLNAAMARWAAQAGWQLLWELPVDYAVEARTTVRGSFEEAVNTVAKSMESAEIPMKAVFYQGNKVLRIMSKGSE
ncbi:toxin co-regulated pilus biosynthesis Q family protein [Herbaspirillum sp. RV1423]|uniref:toxin co-regulated pilus biosynthesis Q family protein n=1 Tax=Herbaspirillum sp. RV1423 TaxID=1443993 RepID=UPI0009DFBF54|nr:toxin co-regulated pilus biosynthesis Q family protein [Herbaspirillum sp. RV1423]